MVYLELSIVLLLIVLNGVFAMSELAIVSAKRMHLKRLADGGNKAAAQALAFAEDTGRFLPTVQIGITLIGILSGVFSGATLGDYLTTYLTGLGIQESKAEVFSVSLIVVVVTYLTLVIGELVPKEVALRKPERMALFVAPVIYRLSKITWPFVWVLNTSSTFVLWLVRAGKKPETTVTQEEVAALIKEGEEQGVFEKNEREMISGVMLLANKPIRAFMIPRGNVTTIGCEATLEEVHGIVSDSGYSRLPVRDPDNENHIIGIVQIKDVLLHVMAEVPFNIREIVQPTTVFADTTNTVEILEHLRQDPVHMAIIVDEQGGFEGIVTLTDLLAVVVGHFSTDGESGGEVVRRHDGSWLVDGSLLIEPAFDKLGIPPVHDEMFHTVAGFMLHHLKTLPTVGEHFIYKGFRFEVVDMDGNRVDKILVQKAADGQDK